VNYSVIELSRAKILLYSVSCATVAVKTLLDKVVVSYD